MNLQRFQTTPKQFYKMGIIIFIIVALCNIASLFLHIKTMDIFGTIQNIAFTIFYVLMAGFFKYALNQEPTEKIEQASDDIDEIIKGIKK